MKKLYLKFINCTGLMNNMPRKEYKTITVKVEAFQKFIRAIRDAQKSDPSLDNSTFLTSLLGKKSKKSR
jgi:hypothetical protein